MPPRAPEPLTSEEILTAHSALVAYEAIDTDETLTVEGVLSGGYFNRSYLVQTAKAKFVLRRYDLNTDPEAIQYEHQLLAFLKSPLHHARLAKPELAHSGETIVKVSGKHYSLFPYLPGIAFDRRNLILIEEAGRTLAAYHNSSASYAPGRRQRVGYGTVANLDWVAQYAGGLSRLWDAVAGIPVVDERGQFIYESLHFLNEEEHVLRGVLTETVYSALPQLVIHNDFGPQNLLCNGDEVVGLLDFDLVAWDARAYDLATAIIWFSEDLASLPPYHVFEGDRPWTLNVERGQMFLRGYMRGLGSPLTTPEIEILPWFLRTFELWMAVWYLDLRVAGLEWYPEELTGLLSAMRWFRVHSESYVSAILPGARA